MMKECNLGTSSALKLSPLLYVCTETGICIFVQHLRKKAANHNASGSVATKVPGQTKRLVSTVSPFLKWSECTSPPSVC